MTFGNFTYLVYMAIFSWLPILLVTVKYRKYVKKNFSVIKKTFVLIFPIALVWDAMSIYSKAWQYSTDMIINIYISIMPIEEILLLASSILGVSVITILFYEYLHKHKIIN